jgi:hypothetical protein
MAAGDVIQFGPTSKAQNEYLDLQPGAGVECVIHNIVFGNDAELYIYDGTNSVKVNARTGNGAWSGVFLHCTNTKYYRVKAINASAQYIYADGMVTK